LSGGLRDKNIVYADNLAHTPDALHEERISFVTAGMISWRILFLK
jgi:hypothetical protein